LAEQCGGSLVVPPFGSFSKPVTWKISRTREERRHNVFGNRYRAGAPGRRDKFGLQRRCWRVIDSREGELYPPHAPRNGLGAVFTDASEKDLAPYSLRQSLGNIDEFHLGKSSAERLEGQGNLAQNGRHGVSFLRRSLGNRDLRHVGRTPECESLFDMTERISLVVCEGDETGQELLEEALRVFSPGVLSVDVDLIRFDLSLANRRRTNNGVVHDAAAAMVETGLGLKAATITPTEIGSVGSPNRILREGVGGSVIVRTGRRIPGVVPIVPVVNPIVVVRMAVGDAYGAAEGRDGLANSSTESAWRTERIDRGTCTAVAEFSFRTADHMGGCVYGGPKWTVSAVYEGMLKEEMDAAAARHSHVPYRPTLIDAAYAGLLTEGDDQTLVIPALNRDGDCLSDLVLAMFGSIAGAESVLLSLDDDLQPTVAMAEAPHGTAPTLAGKNIANPMAMLLACAAALDHAAMRGNTEIANAAGAIRTATLSAAADGIRTFDLGGEATTSGVVDEVLRRLSLVKDA